MTKLSKEAKDIIRPEWNKTKKWLEDMDKEQIKKDLKKRYNEADMAEVNDILIEMDGRK